ncbi:hypothetical protein KIF24_12860 [Micromonospora sp. Llam7]|uniref:DUF4180 domain-containing protein n=1 Tax=Micromonospora tarapacensis TaxID=2835305 RepID=UPI001C8373A8|nr:DUF4180 domain-containing protein [Micromonospora tarapacensis]MBX7266831.1 hypothetical protein [Micromonospora tarapacensis]
MRRRSIQERVAHRAARRPAVTKTNRWYASISPSRISDAASRPLPRTCNSPAGPPLEFGDRAGQTFRRRFLRDLVTESNRGTQVWFVADLDGLDHRLA